MRRGTPSWAPCYAASEPIQTEGALQSDMSFLLDGGSSRRIWLAAVPPVSCVAESPSPRADDTNGSRIGVEDGFEALGRPPQACMR
ncbi:hypothetical protein BFL43_04260 [Williamsia sp. 1135]|nr:hypothetical protein BFL43_04260 [Williamsia sp. 1135]